MEAGTTVKILFALFGFVWGGALPLGIIYSVRYIKKHGHAVRAIVRLLARLLLLVVGFAIALGLCAQLLISLAGMPSTDDVEVLAEFLAEAGLGTPGAIGMAVGMWGGLLALLLGLWRGRRRRRRRSPAQYSA